MIPYEISIWEDTLVKRDDLEYVNVYSGLDTDLNDLGFWYLKNKFDEYFFKIEQLENKWTRFNLYSGKNKPYSSYNLSTGISYIKPNQDYTLVFEGKNLFLDIDGNYNQAYCGRLEVNTLNKANIFQDKWDFYVTNLGTFYFEPTYTNDFDYKCLFNSEKKGFLLIVKMHTPSNVITSQKEIGLNTKLDASNIGEKGSYSWSADFRCALYEGHTIFNEFYNNSNSTYEDFYNLQNTYYPPLKGEKEYFKENKIATIGSEKISAPYRAVNPIFTKNTNGTSSLSFSLYSKYFDEQKEKVLDNPFIKYMSNERKIKLKYKDEWYDFVIKSISESSENYRFDYIAKDLFINELSKIGFEKTFQTELLNNTGTIIELGKEVLSNTNWTIDEENTDFLYQTIEDRVYEAKTNITLRVTKYSKTENGISKTESFNINPGTTIMVFYNSLSSQSKQLEFLYNQKEYLTDMNNVIFNADYCILDNVEYKEDSIYPYIGKNLVFKNAILDISKIGKRLISEIEQAYYAPLNRYVTVYNKDGEIKYGYIENEYETTPIITNLITNSKNFTNLTGWGTSNGKINGKKTRDAKISLEMFTIKTEKGEEKRSGLNLALGANGQLGELSGHFFNSGFSDNISFVKQLKKGDEYILRLTVDSDMGPALYRINPILAPYNKTIIEENPNLGDNTYFPYGSREYNPDFLIQFSQNPYTVIDSENNTKRFYNNMYDPNDLIPVYINPTESWCNIEFYDFLEDKKIEDNVLVFYTYRSHIGFWKDFGTTVGDGAGLSFLLNENGYNQWCLLTGYGATRESDSSRDMQDKDIAIGIRMSLIEEVDAQKDKYKLFCYQYKPSYELENGGESEFYISKKDNLEIKWHLVSNISANLDLNDHPKIPDTDIDNVFRARNVWKVLSYDYIGTIGESEKTKRIATATLEAKGVYEGPDLSYSDLLTKNIGLFLQDNSGISYNLGLAILEAQLYKAYRDENNNIYTPEDVPGSDVRKIYRYFDPEDSNNLSLIEVSDATPLTYEYEGYKASDDYIPVKNKDFVKKNSITATESNCYNLIQKLCETFECWAEFNIEHLDNGQIKLDENYKPIKKVSFKEYIGKDNYAGFKYGTNLNSIKRTLDSSQFVSKIIVKNNSNEYGKDGFCSIARAENNPSGENYLFDFSYYINQGLLDKEKTLKDLYEDFYIFLNSYKKRSAAYIEERKRLSVLVSNLKALYESYELAIQNTENLLSEYKTRFTQLTGYNYSYYLGVLNSEVDSSLANNSTFIDYKTKIEYYIRLLDGFTSLMESSKSEYRAALQEYEMVNNGILRIAAEKQKLYSSFYNRYSYYIQEGSWISEDYMDDERYYFDALKTLKTSSAPKVSYTIGVTDISNVKGFENYSFDIGDKTYIQDTDFFGWEYINGIKTPYKEEVIISEIHYNLDEPEKNQIKVQNYKTQFEDLFQRMAATVQAVQYGTGKYSNRQTSNSNENRFNKLNNEISKLQSQIKYLT